MVPTSAPARLPIAAPATPYRISWLLRLPYPLRSMLRRWRGMLGMMIGVGIALSIAMTMFAIGRASIDLYTADFIRSGVDLYVVAQGGTLIPVLPGDTPGTIKQARRVLSQVRGMPQVNDAIGIMTWSMERQREGPRRRDAPTELFSVMGVDGDPTLIPNVLSLNEGRWPRRANEVVIGSKVSREKGLGLGQRLRLDDRDFTIVGVGKLRGFGFGGDSLVYMDYDAFRDRADIGDVVSIIAVDTAQPEAVRQRLPDVASLTAYSPPELVKKAEEVNASSVAFNWILSLLSLSVAALFVSNMLGRSVVERRLEFATLRAIGIPSRTILLVVAAEAMLVSLVAGAIGVVVSLGFGVLINIYIAQPYGLESLYTADAGVFLLVYGLAIGLGLAAGFFPARQATRVDPVDILREA